MIYRKVITVFLGLSIVIFSIGLQFIYRSFKFSQNAQIIQATVVQRDSESISSTGRRLSVQPAFRFLGQQGANSHRTWKPKSSSTIYDIPIGDQVELLSQTTKNQFA